MLSSDESGEQDNFENRPEIQQALRKFGVNCGLRCGRAADQFHDLIQTAGRGVYT